MASAGLRADDAQSSAAGVHGSCFRLRLLCCRTLRHCSHLASRNVRRVNLLHDGVHASLLTDDALPYASTPASMHLKAFRQRVAFQWLKNGYTLHVVTDSVRSLGLPLRLEGRGRRLCPLTLVDTLEYLSSSSRESSEPWFRSSSTCLLDVFVACADGYYLYAHWQST